MDQDGGNDLDDYATPTTNGFSGGGGRGRGGGGGGARGRGDVFFQVGVGLLLSEALGCLQQSPDTFCFIHVPCYDGIGRKDEIGVKCWDKRNDQP